MTANESQLGIYEKIGLEVGKLVQEKQEAYGDSFGRSGPVMRCFYPNGITPDCEDDTLFMARMIDKLFRFVTRKNAFGESPVLDMIGYCLLQVQKDNNKCS